MVSSCFFITQKTCRNYNLQVHKCLNCTECNAIHIYYRHIKHNAALLALIQIMISSYDHLDLPRNPSPQSMSYQSRYNLTKVKTAVS